MSDLGELGRFEADLRKDENLRERLDETVRRIASEGGAESYAEIMVAAAAELGYQYAW